MVASLSEQDFESVGGASGREGLRRTRPNSWKFARPGSSIFVFDSLYSGSRVEMAGESSHGVGSSCAAMVSSILASPQGASEQYMKSLISGFNSKG